MKLEARSLKQLSTVHSDLQRVILLAAQNSELEFIVTEGKRTLERQKELFLAKKSQTMNSRHLTGMAVDLAIWIDRDMDRVVDIDEFSWKFPEYKKLSDVVKKAAKALNVPIVWGGDWATLRDGPHFELDRRSYP